MLVRTDISPDHQIVQAAHAVLEHGRLKRYPTHTHPHFVFCAVPDEKALVAACDRLRSIATLDHLLIHWWDDSPTGQREMTAICVGPVYGRERNFFRRYQLLKQGVQP